MKWLFVLGFVLMLNDYDRGITLWVTPDLVKEGEYSVVTAMRLACWPVIAAGKLDATKWVLFELHMIRSDDEKRKEGDDVSGQMYCGTMSAGNDK
jgi:hypothetical protein